MQNHELAGKLHKIKNFGAKRPETMQNHYFARKILGIMNLALNGIAESAIESMMCRKAVRNFFLAADGLVPAAQAIKHDSLRPSQKLGGDDMDKLEVFKSAAK